MKKIQIFIASLFIAGCSQINDSKITSFGECAAAGYPIMESYPRQCRTKEGDLYIEQLTNPVSDDIVECPADARLCPDGSSVGRSGPNCEFAECPN